jgi:hypothetical protein
MPRSWMIAAMLAAGCAGELKDPDRFTSLADAGGCAAEPVFAATCASSVCHDAVDPAEGLDLASPGVASRLLGVTSASAACGGRLLVDPDDRPASLLLEKLTAAPTCGDPMPLAGTPLTAEQVECVTTWVEGL